MYPRVVSVVLVVILAMSLTVVGGCSMIGGDTTAFTLEYDVQQEAAASFFIEGDSIETVLASNPFYSGNRAVPGEGMAEFEAARAKKVERIIELAGELVVAADAAEPALADLRTGYLAYLDSVGEEEVLSEFKSLSVKELGGMALKEAVARGAYDAALETKSDTAYAASMASYLAVNRAQEFGALMLEDFNALVGHAALAMKEIESGGSDAAKQASAGFDGTAEGLVTGAVEALEPVAALMTTIQDEFTLLATADYYVAVEANGWMQAEAAALQEQLDALEPREGLDEQDIADIRAAAAAFMEWNDTVSGLVEGLDTAGLAEVEARAVESPFSVGRAYAADGAFEAGAAFGKAVSAADMQASTSKGILETTWEGVKSAASAVTTGIGVAVDSAGAQVHAVSRVACGAWYGNSMEDIGSDIRDNVKTVADNYEKGVSGADTLQTALDYVEATEGAIGDAAGGATEWTAEAVFGKGRVSGAAGWAANGVAKLTAGMFTGLAKGVYKVANKKSSAGDVALGAVEIGLSMVGGSKVILKGSQVPGLIKGGGEAIKSGGGAFVNLVKGMSTKADRKAVLKKMTDVLAKNRKLSAEQAEQLISNSIKVEAAEAVEKALAAQREALVKKLQELMAKGLGGLKTNAAEGAEGMVKMVRDGLDDSLKGLVEAAAEITGKTGTDYIDNLIGSAIDNKIGELIGEAMSLAPGPELMSGTWTGSVTISGVDVKDAAAAEEQGCDVASLENLVGRTFPLTFVISMAGGSGTVQFSGFEDSTGSGTIAYSNGNVTIAVDTESGPLTFVGRATVTQGGGLLMVGTTVMDLGPVALNCTWTTSK